MIKIISVKQIEENIFDVFVSNFGKRQHFSVTRKSVFLEEMSESMPFLNCDDKEFSEIYGHSLKIRQRIWNLINQSESQKLRQSSELQAA